MSFHGRANFLTLSLLLAAAAVITSHVTEPDATTTDEVMRLLAGADVDEAPDMPLPGMIPLRDSLEMRKIRESRGNIGN
ncbi:hypothetical protein Aduo_001220 [Ancylostoma duodenale]